MQLENVVLLEYLLFLNDNLWLVKRLFHSPSANPRYTKIQWSCYVTFTNYVVNLTVPIHWTFCFILLYIHSSSNHPVQIIKQLANYISKDCQKLPLTKNFLIRQKLNTNEDSLKKSSYNFDLK